MSWHINKKGISFIRDIVALMKDNDDYYMDIYMDSQIFKVTNKDKVVIGVGSLLIYFENKDVVLINTNMIEYIDLQRPSYTEESEE